MAVKYFDWDDAKNAKLTKARGLGFEDIVLQRCSTSVRNPTTKLDADEKELPELRRA